MLLDELEQPDCTSSCSESTSDVIRETITPAFSRSKNGIDSRCRWSKTRTRRSRRKPSPTRLTISDLVAVHDVGR